jgi:hypothetical protein
MMSFDNDKAWQPETVCQVRPIFYISADGIYTPMHQGGTCEAKVGMMFLDADHLRLSQSRAMLKQREYVAALDGVDGFATSSTAAMLTRSNSSFIGSFPLAMVLFGYG